MTPATVLVSKPTKRADAVVLVHDVVAGPQVGERARTAAADAARRPALAPEQLRRGQDGDSASCVRHEAAPQPRDDEVDAGRRRQGGVRARAARSSTRLSCRAVRSASPRCGNAISTRWPPRTCARSSFSASAMPRAAMAGRCALEGDGLALRQRVERVHAVDQLADVGSRR